jgi:adenosylmethionine-8-amino-7-oxononanoate aminotransferase
MASTNGHVFYRAPGRRLPVVERAAGVFLWDADDRRYLDGVAGALVVNVGHGRREVLEAMADQARRATFVHGSHFTNPPQERLAEELAALTPGDLNRVLFVSGGSEATETALKVARLYHLRSGRPERRKVIARWTSYHGGTLGALSMSGHVPRRRAHGPLLLEVPHIDPPYRYRCRRCDDGTCEACSGRNLEEAILREGPDQVAAFIAEPVVGAAGGAITPPPGYYRTIREICDRYGVLFIADEVMTGVGRTGRMFGIEHWGVAPDLLVLGKGLASGYSPLAAVAVREDVHDALVGGEQAYGFTYAGNPLSCAAGLACLRLVREEALPERAAVMGQRLRAGLGDLAERHPTVGDVRGLGLMLGVELVRDRETKEPFPADLRVADRLDEAALRRGLVLYPGRGHVDGARGDQFLIGPPLTITAQEVDLLLDLLDGALSDLERALAV